MSTDAEEAMAQNEGGGPEEPPPYSLGLLAAIRVVAAGRPVA